MKILILGTSRSGTTSLARGIENQSYFTFYEPFNQNMFDDRDWRYPITDFNKYEKVCVKTLCLQTPLDINIDSFSFYKSFVKDFDKIILLDRKNINEHKQSFLHLYYRLENKESVNLKWDKNTVTKKFKNKFISENRYQELTLQKTEIKKISDFLDNEITYYEDLYGADREKSLKLIMSWKLDIDNKILNEYLHPKFKLKQENKII